MIYTITPRAYDGSEMKVELDGVTERAAFLAAVKTIRTRVARHRKDGDGETVENIRLRNGGEISAVEKHAAEVRKILGLKKITFGDLSRHGPRRLAVVLLPEPKVSAKAA